jgi:excinuclease ABC subunit A
VKQEALWSADPMVIGDAGQNNLKNLKLSIPNGELIVVTGVSGPSNSSLIFDTLYAEAQRRSRANCAPVPASRCSI